MIEQHTLKQQTNLSTQSFVDSVSRYFYPASVMSKYMMSGEDSTLNALQHQRHSLSYSDTHRCQSLMPGALFQLMHRRHHQACTRCTEGMT